MRARSLARARILSSQVFVPIEWNIAAMDGRVSKRRAMDLTVECPHCRCCDFIRSANPRRDEWVTCVSCSIRFRYGELEDRATKSVRALLSRLFPAMALD